MHYTQCCVQFMIGWLLHKANRDVPLLYKDRFYRIKHQILIKYGTKIGQEIQHIKKECWACDGSGIFKCEWKEPESCWSCRGTGVYEEFWSRLDKYKLGNWYFHNPIERLYKYEPLFEGEALPIIEGYIRHVKPKYRIGTECALWLFLFYDRETFWKFFGRIGYPSNKRTPLVIIGNLIFVSRNFDLRDYLPTKNTKYEYETDDLPF